MEGGFPSIIELWIDYNPDLTGSIPAYIGDLTTLESLSISMNGLAGELPSEIGKLEDLKQFWINGNELVGDIPVEFGGLLKLKLLRLEDNLFSGSMPHQVCDNVGFLRPLETLGADCDLECHCCTCCGTDECSAA